MVQKYGDFVRARRGVLRLSQRDVAKISGVKQPLIAAVESGARAPSGEARAALNRALRIRPSQALAACRDQVRDRFARLGLPEPLVFGSVARGEDTPASDLDLLVHFTDDHDIVDLLTLEDELSTLLTVKVDLVDARSDGRVTGQGHAEAVAL